MYKLKTVGDNDLIKDSQYHLLYDTIMNIGCEFNCSVLQTNDRKTFPYSFEQSCCNEEN